VDVLQEGAPRHDLHGRRERRARYVQGERRTGDDLTEDQGAILEGEAPAGCEQRTLGRCAGASGDERTDDHSGTDDDAAAHVDLSQMG
jgi:hypothetical protein